MKSDAGNRLVGDFDNGVLLELGIHPRFEVLRLAGRPITVSFPVSIGLSLGDYFESPDSDDDEFGFLRSGMQVSLPLIVTRSDGDRRFTVDLEMGL